MAGGATAKARIVEECGELLPRLLRRRGPPAKLLAFRLGTTPRAVQNWAAGEHIPSMPAAIMLAREIPEFRVKMLEWLEASEGEIERDPTVILGEIHELLRQRFR